MGGWLDMVVCCDNWLLMSDNVAMSVSSDVMCLYVAMGGLFYLVVCGDDWFDMVVMA